MIEPGESELQIGHVLFIDIVGYSKLLMEDQKERLHQLTEIVLQTPQVREATDEKLVRLPTGDGMALVFCHSVAEPARCALEIAEALKKHPQIPVRMGIHSGPVSEVTDVSGRTNLAGAGINLAQRVMDCGDAGHILLSQRVADDLAQYRQWAPRLHDLGECEVKHGVRLHLVNLFTDESGNSKTPEKFKRPGDESVGRHIRAKQNRMSLILIVSLITAALLIGSFLLWQRQKASASAAKSPIPEKSIAVLPFENMSSEKENAYFADGIQDEILTRLSKIADLKVISRTSTQHYKSAPENLPEIAKQLGVAHIVEGSVQKSGNAVRVNVQLIKAANDSHLWADTFDRKLTDIFAVESEIATTIADALQARLTGSEKEMIKARPTSDTTAYELYLKGRVLWAKRSGDNVLRAIAFFEQAIAHDPNYALAYSGLAEACVVLPFYTGVAPDDAYAKAKAAAVKALRLNDKLAEAHAALGFLLSRNELDMAGSVREFQRAIALNPNYATAHQWYGVQPLTALGRFEEAVAEGKRAIELDPLSLVNNADLGWILMEAGRYDEAISHLRKSLEIDPTFYPTRFNLAVALQLKGDLPAAIAEYTKVQELTDDVENPVMLATAKAQSGDKSAAVKMLSDLEKLGKNHYAGGAYWRALLYLSLGNRDEAIRCLEQAVADPAGSDIVYIKVFHFFDPLRGDPRFEALVQKVIAPKNG